MKLSTKIILSLVFFTSLATLIILFISVGAFKKDKMGFIFEANSKEVFYRAQIIKNEFDKKSSVVKLKFENAQFEQKDFDETANSETGLVYLEVFKLNQKMAESAKKFTLPQNQYSGLVADVFKNELLSKAIESEDLKGISAFENYYIIWEKFNLKENSALVVYSFKSEEIEKMKNEESDKKYIIFDSKKNVLSLIHTQQAEVDRLSGFLSDDYDQFFKTINSTSVLRSDVSGQQWIVSFASLGFMNVYIASVQSEAKAFSFLKLIYYNSALLFVMILSVIFIFGLISTKIIVRKLNELTTVAQELSLGNLNQEIKTTGSDEVGTLAKTFSIMIVKIKELISQVADKARMENELKTAQIVQSTFFSKFELDSDIVKIRSKASFASECGGDWWAFEETEEDIWVWIADATGHGAPAALLTSAIRSATFLIEKMNLSLPEVMKNLNETIFKVSNGNMALTCFVCKISKKNRTLEFANAAHNPPVWMGGVGVDEVHFLDFPDKNFKRIGHQGDSTYESLKMTLSQGQRFVLYTDGIFEIENAKGRMNKERDLIKSFKEANQSVGFEDFYQKLMRNLGVTDNQKNLIDDLSLLVIEVK